MSFKNLPRKRVLLAVSVFLLICGAGWVGYTFFRTAAATPPPIPDDVEDPLVREALQRMRDTVLRAPRSAQSWGELGLVFKAHDINPQARACFEQAALLDPDDARWPYLIAITNIALAGDVIPHLRDSYRLASEPQRKGAVRMRLAESLLDAGKLDEASDLFLQQLRANPGDPRAHLGLGMAALARNNTEEAVSELAIALESPFARQRASRLLAAAHKRLGHAKDADLYEHAATTGAPDRAWPDPFLTDYLTRRVGRRALAERIGELESQGRFAEASETAEQLVQTYRDEQSLVTLGKILAQAGELARAEETLREAIHQNADSIMGHFFLARTLSLEAQECRARLDEHAALKRDLAAIEEYQRCIALKPGHGPAYIDLGRVLMRVGRTTEAIEACREAVRISPQAMDTHLAMGEILLNAGKAQEAVPVLEQAARLAAPQDLRAATLLERARSTMK